MTTRSQLGESTDIESSDEENEPSTSKKKKGIYFVCYCCWKMMNSRTTVVTHLKKSCKG